LLGEHLDDIHHREPLGLGGLIKGPADGLIFEGGWELLHGGPYKSPLKAQ